MTDDLVIGLRKRRDQGSKMAAARIEQDAARIARLEGERDYAQSILRNWTTQASAEHHARIAAEAKLARAVDGLQFYSAGFHDHGIIARNAIAEIEGGA